MGSSKWTSDFFEGVNKPSLWLKCGNLVETNWNFDDPAAELFKTATRRFGTQQPNHVPKTSQWCPHRSGVGFQQEGREQGRWHHSLPLTLRNKLETLKHRVEVSLTKQLQVQRLANA